MTLPTKIAEKSQRLPVFFSILCGLFFSSFSPAQQKSEVFTYARKIVDTLASPSMYGRGYVNKGDSIAADYIKGEFEKIGAKQIGKEYYQRFGFNINTFPMTMKMESKEKVFVAGKDFIVEGGSGTVNGVFETVWFNNKILNTKKAIRKFKKINFSNKVIIVDPVGIDKIKDGKNLLDAFELNLLNAKAVVFIEENKLTAGYSRQQENYLSLTILRKNINSISDTIWINIENKFLTNYSSQNILSYIKGTQYPDSFIVFTAHYDHLGMMGKDTYFPGANDNASGVAMLLNLAKHYSQNPPKCSVAFMAFGAEEAGLLGSKYYVEHPLFPLSKIKFLLNFDILGTGDEGIKVVNGTEHKPEFDALVKINSEKTLLPSVQPRGKAAISDHHFFEEAGVKTFYIYTLGGIKAYHDIYDRAETLPLTEFEDLFKLITEFSDKLQN